MRPGDGLGVLGLTGLGVMEALQSIPRVRSSGMDRRLVGKVGGVARLGEELELDDE